MDRGFDLFALLMTNLGYRDVLSPGRLLLGKTLLLWVGNPVLPPGCGNLRRGLVELSLLVSDGFGLVPGPTARGIRLLRLSRDWLKVFDGTLTGRGMPLEVME